MTEQRKTDVARFYDAEAAEYHRMYQRENLETSERYPANYFRLQILVRRLASLGAKRVYEIGVGEGSPLVAMAKLGLEVAGCDISEAMVAAARKNFLAAGLSQELIQWGDVEDATTMDKLWPDFAGEDLKSAIVEFGGRKRRYGAAD